MDVAAPPRALTGDVSAAYFVQSSATKLRVHGGNAFRAPALYERFGGGFSTDPITGRLLFTAFGDPRLEPDRYQTIDGGADQYLFNAAFRWKVIFITIAGLNVLFFYTRIFRRLESFTAEHHAPPIGARLVGGVSLAAWVGVMSAGRLLTFFRP